MNTKDHKKDRIRTKRKKYFECERCGYVTIVKDSECPICAKEGVIVKLS